MVCPVPAKPLLHAFTTCGELIATSKHCHDFIHVQAARTTHVFASNIVTLAQIQSGTLQSLPSMTVVRSLMRSVIEQVKAMAPAGVVFALHVAPNVPSRVCVDGYHLKQVRCQYLR